MDLRKLSLLAGLVLACSALSIALTRARRGSAIPGTVTVGGPTRDASVPVDSSYGARVQPIFDRRCVVCHACFDAPCQLNLQAFEGVDRGANKTPVYNPSRLDGILPTRLFRDALTTGDWQQRFGFFPVLSRVEPEQLSGSLIWRLIEQRRQKPLAGFFDVDSSATCPASLDELKRELAARPELGMPFGFPPLSDSEADTLAAWLKAGSPRPPAAPEATGDEAAALERWEAFFNADDPRSQLVSRYLFEHLFFAHLRFEGISDTWYRLVRVRKPAPAPADEIVTVRPYDDPGVTRAYYRLQRVRETIIEKTHVPYLLDDAKLARLKQLFLAGSWDATPSESRAVTNPFLAFQAIPARARYQFLLDDAHYFVKTFIHGPVCKGQVALNVIDEHFLIFFLAPSADPAVTDPAYLAGVAEYLGVPTEGGDGVEAIYLRFKLHEAEYLKAQEKKLAAMPGRSLTDAWDGDGAKPDAVLTVYRHFDNAFVVRGAVGGVSKTAWVMDYPILERMYYDLAAGFNVFGNVIHQVSARRYMNLLRIESEAQFLRFLPKTARAPIRSSWYRGKGVSALVDALQPSYAGPEPLIEYRDLGGAKAELIERILHERLGPAVVGAREPIQWRDAPLSEKPIEAQFESLARSIAGTPGSFVQVFPDAALLQVQTGKGPDQDLVYSVIRNRSHANIDFMFLENDFLMPEEDTLHVVPGVALARPNLFLSVSSGELARFFEEWRALSPSDASFRKFLDRYGVRRHDPRFWATSDFFNTRFRSLDPVGGALLDLLRYGND